MAVQACYAGDRLIEQNFGPFRFDETRYPCGLKMACHCHTKPHLSCLIGGSFGESLGKHEYVRNPGTVIFRRSDIEHTCQFYGDPVRILRVQFDEKWLRRIEAMADARPRSFATQSPLTASLAHRLLHELAFGESVSELSAEGLVLELVAEAFRAKVVPHSTGEPTWLRNVRDALHAEFIEQRSLADLAADAGVHPSYLARAFRSRYGCTIGEYLRRLRVDFAAERLRRGDEPLAEIAQAAGFADQGHFTRQFRRATGFTPGQYRRRAALR